MKDIQFGKRMQELRKSFKLSQKELGFELGVSDKAVSKWENGDGYPSMGQMLNVAELFDVSVDSLLKGEKNKDKNVHKIVITGGPCAGKSTALSWIQNEFTKRGYYVFVVSETATDLILSGISPEVLGSVRSFQKYIVESQLQKERLYDRAVREIKGYNKFLIVYDRGVMDTKAYITDIQFQKILRELGTDEITVRDGYDAVFHLVTAAKGAREYYNYENKARKENPDEAEEKDEKTKNAWIGHPHFRVIGNEGNFETKLKTLLKEIALFLGDKKPYEIERKFLIEYPNVENLKKMENCSEVEIIQTYLKTNDEEEVRIRQRGQNGSFIYTKTIKRKVDELKRIETEKRISADEYLRLMLQANTSQNQIRKTRYCLLYKNQYFEIDIFPFWKDKAIMELELTHEKQGIKFPKFIKIIEEVTGKEEYYNKNLAK